MKRNYLIIMFALIFSVVHLQNSIHAWAENNYLLPDNKDKHFISAKDFIKHDKLKLYSPFNEAKINFQHKLLYKELNQFIKSNVNEYYYKKLINIYSNRNDTVSPNRQVYFYCSILETENAFNYKYVIFDSETTGRIAEGGGQSFKETN